MSFDERLDRAISQTLSRLREHIGGELDTQLKSLSEELRSAAHAERESAVRDAQAAAHEEAALKLDALQAEGEQKLSAMAAELERAKSAAAQTTRGDEPGTPVAGIEGLLDVVRRLDAGLSLSDVLAALCDGVGRQAARLALFLVQGSRARSWRLTGFESEIGDTYSIEFDTAADSVIGRTAATGERSVARDPLAEPSDDLGGVVGGLPFAPLPEDGIGIAVPVHVGGKVVAVMYADNAANGEPPTLPLPLDAIELLTRHAARCLEALTVALTSHGVTGPATTDGVETDDPAQPSHTAGAHESAAAPAVVSAPAAGAEENARRYARLVIAEVKLTNEAAVRVGRQQHDLARRLRAEIDRARQLYDEHVPAGLRLKNLYFEQELVRTLADGDTTLMGDG